MIVLFVNSEKIGSKIIQYGDQEKMSHVAVGFDDHGFIYHASVNKIQKTPVQAFHDHYNLIDCVKISLTEDDEIKIRDLFLNSIWYEGYDYKAVIYFAWDRLKARLFGTAQAKTNPMASDVNMICPEIIYLLDEFYHDVTSKYLLPEDVDLSITKPGQLCTILKSRFA